VDARVFVAMLLALLVWSAIVGLGLWQFYERKVAPEIQEVKASFAESPLGKFGL
jgi:hypothetical protein